MAEKYEISPEVVPFEDYIYDLVKVYELLHGGLNSQIKLAEWCSQQVGCGYTQFFVALNRRMWSEASGYIGTPSYFCEP